MTRPTLHSAAAAACRPSRWRRICAERARLLAVVLLGLALAACGGGAGGGGTEGGGGGDVPLATEPVDLPPGQTAVQLTWEPSAGLVTGYAVFVSRNGGRFTFQQVETETSTIIEGQPGDEVRVLVTALGTSDSSSEPSPPSVPIRFYAATADSAVAAASAAPLGSGLAAAAVDPTPSETGRTPDPEPIAPADSAPDPDASLAPDSSTSDPASAEDDPTALANDAWTSELRMQLLLADVRLPLGERSAAAADWIRSWLEGTPLAELEPIGTPEHAGPEDGGEGQRDIVWLGANGQLYLSDGPTLAASPPSSWLADPTLALGPDERWVALADLDGDAVREWLIENRATGEVFHQRDALAPAQLARAVDQPASDRLVGPGDLDGDGRIELLWLGEDGALALARPTGRMPAFADGAWPPPGAQVVALADLTGDGRDDLIARHPDGRTAYGIVVDDEATGSLALSWTELQVELDADGELIATLDEDGDGRAALVWRSGDRVEIRGPFEAMPRAF